LCLEVMVDVVLVTDDGTVHVNFQPAFEEAILDGRLEGILNTEDFNTTLILYLDEDELPTAAPSTNSTQEPTSTQSPAPSSLSPSISTDETDPDGNETDSFDDDELFNNITESPSFFNSSDLDFNETDPNEGDENVTVTMSPTEDVNVTMSPTEDVTVTMSPTEDVNGTMSPTEDVNGTMSPTEDVNGTMSPTEDVNVTMSPTEDVNGTMSPTNKTCVDKRDECKAWVEEGECDNNPKFMLLNCQAHVVSVATKNRVTTSEINAQRGQRSENVRRIPRLCWINVQNHVVNAMEQPHLAQTTGTSARPGQRSVNVKIIQSS
jgi:ShK domain-like